MSCCLNSDCPQPINPDGNNYCQTCGTKIVSLLRGHYRIIKLLGQGGFGKTYLAEDVDKFDRYCVVKQLAPKVREIRALHKAIQLFEQEARQLQKLGEENPQIPALYAYFEESGYLYLVQQFIDGQNLLKEMERRGIWNETEIRELLLSLLPVLKFIHQQGIIHRDIKPENIMRWTHLPSLSANENKEELVLIDFGVSKQLSGAVKTTVVGTNIGSQGYAPLEQMEMGKAYLASDLFSLGATCFHLLTNIHPYHLWVERGYSWMENWQEHLKNPISKQLALAIDKLLQKDVSLRYQTAEEVLNDLQPIQPSPQPSYQPNQKKSKKPLIIGSAIVLSGLVGYGGITILPSLINAITPQVSWKNTNAIATLTEHTDLVDTVALSPDGKTAASGSYDDSIKLWNLESKQAIATLKGHPGAVNSVAFSGLSIN